MNHYSQLEDGLPVDEGDVKWVLVRLESNATAHGSKGPTRHLSIVFISSPIYSTTLAKP